MKHDIDITVRPPEGTDLDGLFAIRESLSNQVEQSVPSAREVHGGTNYEPLEFDLGFEVESEAMARILAGVVVGWLLEHGYAVAPLGGVLVTSDHEFDNDRARGPMMARIGVHPSKVPASV